jgi:phospholipase C
MPHPQIRHLFVLQLENRSFDHMLGWRPGVNGVNVTPRRKNSVAGQDYLQEPLGASKYVTKHDPPHTKQSIAAQISDDMGHFAEEYRRAHPDRTDLDVAHVMQHFVRGDLPVTDFLADNFAVCDAWFASVATATIPNRLYSMCGHSHGLDENPRAPTDYLGGLDIDDSVFQKLEQAGVPWRVYSGTRLPWAALIKPVRKYLYERTPTREPSLRMMRRLSQDLAAVVDQASADAFPAFVWLEPIHCWADFPIIDPFLPEPNDDHPPSHMMRGQQLLQYVYESIRRSKLWDSSALLIYYDEHGGFYDHVQPPERQPGRDKLTRRGPRVPALVVSPFVQPGSVGPHRPAAGREVFEHTSMLKFLGEQHGIDFALPADVASLGRFFSDDPIAANRGTVPSPQLAPSQADGMESAKKAALLEGVGSIARRLSNHQDAKKRSREAEPVSPLEQRALLARGIEEEFGDGSDDD